MPEILHDEEFESGFRISTLLVLVAAFNNADCPTLALDKKVASTKGGTDLC
jgi:hypothetical protein